MIQSFKRLHYLDFSDNNDVVCDEGVTEFYKMSLEFDNITIFGWENGTGYYCLDAAESFFTYKEYAESQMGLRKWEIILIVSSIVLVTMVTVVSYYVYNNRFFIAYNVLKSSKRLKAKRDPDGDYDYDVFLCYSPDQQEWVTEV